MKPNEKIGMGFFMIAWASLFGAIFSGNPAYLGITILCTFGQIIFLSWWGLTTFNSYFN